MQQSYHHRLQSGSLKSDEHQLRAVRALQQRLDAIESGYKPRSLYLFGPVGRGKSLLMDLFYQHLPANKAVRLHYHHFMARIHRELNQCQGETNPMLTIAKAWAQQVSVICLDEFFVEDIGDAMILARLWEALFDQGVSLITTSNAPPSELYKGGLARHRFEPTIELLNHECECLDLGMGIDYRRLRSTDLPYYLRQGSSEQLRSVVESYFGVTRETRSVEIMNRQIPCLWRNDKAIGFDFMSLCSGPRSQRDYMELANHYAAIAVHNVPAFSYLPDKDLVHGVEETYQREHQENIVSKLDNEARRFIALVDECYDRRCHLIVTAETDIDKLYQAKQLAFPFRRCVSRLFEMQQWASTEKGNTLAKRRQSVPES
ncbi:cell division protein ZapE [Idiomarina sp. HP20-50]|uniref:cell division protein ZapE n=1 Tax=Idiomarina sp. HP20-50 TaxID=3070813 RepID=UPI00294B2023|nr:cell division protein ZapE [Idiomarina sp. HP20-50]MDV6315797.1 cell division protein ZapE [Idiomarina sp. HP20-50]